MRTVSGGQGKEGLPSGFDLSPPPSTVPLSLSSQMVGGDSNL